MPTAVAAIILAAGYSSRMGAFKPLLPLAGASALERAVGLFREAGVGDVRVVTGHRAAELGPLLKRLGVRPIFNPDYPEGMFSSVATGFSSLEEKISACFILPVDLPLVRPATVHRLWQTFAEAPAAVLYPTFGGKRGHPPLIAGEAARRLPGWTGEGGLKRALGQWEAQSREVVVADELILRDMDSPEDFQRLQRRAERLEIPKIAECRELLRLSYASDDPIVRHCEAVARLAVEIGTELNATGADLDLELLEAAGLLHDLARSEPAHARVGAERLRALGFTAVAEVVAVHMDLPLPIGETIDEAQLLFLADKLVQGERRVSLEERFGPARRRHRRDPAVRSGIERRRQTAQTILNRLEKALNPMTERTATP
jgi:CTP:molybdopterin cytidylyltransferase MocA